MIGENANLRDDMTRRKNAVIISFEKMKVNVSTDKEKGAC